jgi:aminomethyltransferase
MENTAIKRTPLYSEHQKLNAKFTEFGGWDMPVQYTSIMDEHNAVRGHCGIFDTSHMGTYIISGNKAGDFLNKITTANATALVTGQAKYALFLNDKAGIIDDLIIYRRTNDYLMVVNAGNSEKDSAWMQKNIIPGASIKNISADICLLALQGPEAQKILQPLVSDDLSKIKYFYSIVPVFKNIKPGFAFLAKTGYTGEAGFEIFLSKENAPELWQKLVEGGAKPCGLGARDTLRLEACMPLHGHEINDDIDPIQAELGWAIFLDKDFIGKQALLKIKEAGQKMFLTALMMDSGIPRAHCEIKIDGIKAGDVVSGTYSPTLKKGIALAYVNRKLNIGDTVSVVIHNQEKLAKVVKRPFYKRQR